LYEEHHAASPGNYVTKITAVLLTDQMQKYSKEMQIAACKKE